MRATVPIASRRRPVRAGKLLTATGLAVLVLLVSALLATAAFAVAPAAHLVLHGFATPTSFSSATPECQAGSVEVVSSAPCNEYQLTVTNVGSKETNGAAIELVDALPAGLSVVATEASLQGPGKPKLVFETVCKVEGGVLVRCKFPLHLGPDERLELLIAVEVKAGTSGVNQVTLSGGGVAGAKLSETNTFDASPQFGLSAFASVLTNRAGRVDSNAGDHPYEYTTRLDLNNVIGTTSANTFQASSVEDVRDIVVDLPVGLVGAATATPYCTLVQLASETHCPADTRVGQIYSEPPSNASVNSAIYNIAPEAGVAAEFGFIDELHNVHVVYSTIVPTADGGYVLRAITREVAQIPLTDAVVTFFGDPSTKNGSPAAPAMFTNGSDCDGQPQVTNIHMDSWLAPGSYNADGSPNFNDPRWVASSSEAEPLEECGALEGLFQPTIKATPGTTQADSPTGLEVDVNVPQQEEGAEALATPPLRNTVVALPTGITVNPSSANGLEGCSLAQIGMSAAGVPDAAAPACPDGSKIGTVELETPALPTEICKSGPDQPFKNLSECPEAAERQKVPLQGSIYVANQSENPFGSLLAIYIVVEDPRTGVVVKLAGEIKANGSTGQLTTVISNSPQFPFTELRTHFFDGPKAPLRTPAVCGSYTLTSQLTPWSAPQSGPPATPQSTFGISSGAAGGACPQSAAGEPNSPSFAAASESPTAAAFSPLVVQIARADGSQEFGQISVTLPPGASGRIAGIPRCSDAQIAQAQARNHLGEGALELASPSCPADSRIGSVTVGAGAGSDPFYVTGNAYLSGPYEGAPFSAVFVTPAKAGPFDLGVVVVRAALLIDPTTAQVTTRSDALPRILQGIPLDIRSLAVKVDRPGFTLTPSNCTPMTVTGEETSTQGQSAPMAARYQVGGCDRLPFKPKLSASAGGKASKTKGTGFTVSLSSAGLGQANIAKVQLQLPKALPSRLTTLQKACLAAVFEANPATCPEGSVIGNATIHTPLLDSQLSGPAYLVSHGNAAFPDVEFVLQGEGVELILDGKTDIKNGITYSRFESAPDAPFTTFQTVLPAGPHSILTANVPQKENYSLCKTSLTMPTTIVSQSGVTIKQNTKIALTGCPKSKPLTRKQKLANALKSCHKKRNKHKRQACEGQARKRYGAVKKAKAKKGSAKR
jgi:hypothetical protein